MEVGAFAVFLSWMGLLLFIQKIPHLGIFVVMFTDILKTFAQFFLVFVFFILGFALAFYILLGNQVRKALSHKFHITLMEFCFYFSMCLQLGTTQL